MTEQRRPVQEHVGLDLAQRPAIGLDVDEDISLACRRDHRLQPLDQASVAPQQGCHQQVVLVREVVVQHPVRHARVVRDGPRRQISERSLLEKLVGRGDEMLAQRRLMGPARCVPATRLRVADSWLVV